jgi:hypothetical protein
MASDFPPGSPDNSILVSLFYGTTGTDRSNIDKWDPTYVGEVVWDEDFTLSPKENQQYFLDFCDTLESFDIVRT